MSPSLSKLERLAPYLFGALICLGSYWSFTRGGNDFLVFYEAWRLVISGKADLIYHVSPDRFLYAPAFAILLAPLGLIPKSLCLGIWCFLKAWILGLCIRTASQFFRLSVGWTSIAFLLAAKPLLIDFQYGQVNILILCVTFMTLMMRMQPHRSSKQHAMLWAGTTLAAFSKLYTLPILAIPFFFSEFLSPEKKRAERGAIVATLLILAIVPFHRGWDIGAEFYLHWFQALQLRGLPIESHNQSFWAFLRHILGSSPTPVLAQGLRSIDFSLGWLSEVSVEQLSFAWFFCSTAFLTGWILTLSRRSPVVAVSVVTASCILPLHLIWKPYFVFTIPLLVLLVALMRKGKAHPFLLVAVGIMINFTGFDFMGATLGAFFEAATLLHWVHLGLLGFVLFKSRQLLPSRALGST